MVNPFVAVSTEDPCDVFTRREHPLKPFESNNYPISTNKFYANLLLDQRTLPAWTHPYSVWWSKVVNFWGLAVSHTTASQRVFGPDPNANPARYYFNPANIQSMNLSAVEFDHNMNLQVTSPGPLSAMITLTTGDGNRMMQVPLASGIGFISAVYYNLSPVIQSQVGFNSFKQLTSPMSNIMKYEVGYTQ